MDRRAGKVKARDNLKHGGKRKKEVRKRGNIGSWIKRWTREVERGGKLERKERIQKVGGEKTGGKEEGEKIKNQMRRKDTIWNEGKKEKSREKAVQKR